MTAAGTIAPARVLILGAGVAGLTAIGTARRLGAVVEAFDVRKAVKEQVESLGAKFVEVESDEDAQTAGGYAKELVRGVQEEAGRGHRGARGEGRRRHLHGAHPRTARAGPRDRRDGQDDEAGSSSSISAAEQQGNCELTEPGKTVVKHGVTIVGETNLPSRSPCTRARCSRATWRSSSFTSRRTARWKSTSRTRSWPAASSRTRARSCTRRSRRRPARPDRREGRGAA